MARLVKHTAKEPQRVEVGDKIIMICMCGLSQNKPYCDGSHNKTLDEEEGKLYRYEGDERIVIEDN